jgi:hypothetical protein
MITNFEIITEELNEKELKIIPILVNGFKNHSQSNPVKAPAIVRNMNNHLKKIGIDLTMTEPRLRKCCNYIRSNSIIPLIATSKGYFVSQDKDIIASQIKSLRERANSINNCANGLETFLNK